MRFLASLVRWQILCAYLFWLTAQVADQAGRVQGQPRLLAHLLGFDLPLDSVKKCVLQVPAPIDIAGPGYSLTASVTDDFWDEATVSGFTKKIDGTPVGSTNVTGRVASEIDVTSACVGAKNHKLSLFVDTSFPLVAFNSIQSGNSDVFKLDYSF
ncbi:hypothetical protein BX661DRAFT_207544 [Kickxella alabastrina]|uniref:uncharacterized protein n=1 Tax=Kickxella alabastrina TaxID=61397 RepID=UPI00221EF820|nr:uncharacterized protein BX661DRAFT_207544 [Kickxella alabastrina]KAI7821427.1 hypothetical protein BX661DRAFT_207544 [Kickxella alabastrina]